MEDPVQNQNQNEVSKEVSNRKISNRALISLIVIACVLVVTVGAYAYRNHSSSKNEAVAASATPSPIASLEVKTPVSDKIVDAGVTWQAPQKIDDQGLFEKSNNDSAYSSTDYYKVGTTASGGEIILAKINIDEPYQGDNLQRIIKNGDTYKRIVQNSADINTNSYQTTNKLQNDSSFVFKSLLADKVITKDDTELVSGQSSKLVMATDSSADANKIASTKWGDMYLEKSKSYSINDVNQGNSDKTPILRIARYYVILNDSTQITYEPRPSFMRDDNTFNLDFQISNASSNKYEKFETGGCGLGFGNFAMMVDNDSLADKVAVASKSGSELDGITNTGNRTLQYAYELYKSDQASGKKSVEEFAADYAFVYWVDAYGSTIGFLNTDYKPALECGKPVVYLYPKEETPFKVSVGAEVNKSEPTYNKGWQGIAKPNGELTVNGKSYSNLFWEGKGYGTYPKVNFGRLVARTNVETEITSDLKTMGLNDQEIADFNAYWLEKMPETQYIRLSWLTNKELDELAPLYISPKPQSVIRVFLDFAGYDKMINLPSQTLPTFERNGYTAVEWGGLLKGK